jgi:hypothetical protein
LIRIRYFLEIEFVLDNEGIFICQHKYAKEILERFGMENCNLVCNPIVQSLLTTNGWIFKVNCELLFIGKEQL